MKPILFSLLFTMLLVTGCTTKSVTLPIKGKPSTNTSVINTPLNTAEETDEFEDEFSLTNHKEINDPLNEYNRIMTSFNDTMFTYTINPISELYATITPEPIRQSVANFIHNIQFPIRLTNNLFQGKFKNSSDELERFIVNTTIGLAGLFDPASIYMHIPTHNEDFGQTLGYYGVGAGFHIVLPFLGPSNMRDVLGLTADAYMSPLQYQKGLKKYKIPNNYGQAIGIYSFEKLNQNSLHLGAYESLKKDAIDLYPFLRDIYEQKRTADIAE